MYNLVSEEKYNINWEFYLIKKKMKVAQEVSAEEYGNAIRDLKIY